MTARNANMAGVDGIRIANNEWRSYSQHNQHHDGKMKHQNDKGQQAQSTQSEDTNKQEENQTHIDEYV